MDFKIEQHFDAPVDEVESALLDPEFIARTSGLPKIGKAALVSQERDGNIVEQEIHYVFSGELSAAVRAVVDPKRISWILESRHDLETHQGTWRIVPDHYGDRLSAEGTTSFAPATIRRTVGFVKVHMALVGGRVERAIVSGLKEHADAEAAELKRFLAER